MHIVCECMTNCWQKQKKMPYIYEILFDINIKVRRITGLADQSGNIDQLLEYFLLLLVSFIVFKYKFLTHQTRYFIGIDLIWYVIVFETINIIFCVYCTCTQRMEKRYHWTKISFHWRSFRHQDDVRNINNLIYENKYSLSSQLQQSLLFKKKPI